MAEPNCNPVPRTTTGNISTVPGKLWGILICSSGAGTVVTVREAAGGAVINSYTVPSGESRFFGPLNMVFSSLHVTVANVVSIVAYIC